MQERAVALILDAPAAFTERHIMFYGEPFHNELVSRVAGIHHRNKHMVEMELQKPQTYAGGWIHILPDLIGPGKQRRDPAPVKPVVIGAYGGRQPVCVQMDRLAHVIKIDLLGSEPGCDMRNLLGSEIGIPLRRPGPAPCAALEHAVPCCDLHQLILNDTKKVLPTKVKPAFKRSDRGAEVSARYIRRRVRLAPGATMNFASLKAGGEKVALASLLKP
jgi:hypothetical protein